MYERRKYIIENKQFNQYGGNTLETTGSKDSRGVWSVNNSSILTRLIQEAGRYCDRFASDLFIDWKGVEKWIENPTERKVWMFGFRRDGVDHDRYVLTEHNKREYRSLWILECDCNDELMQMKLWESDIHPRKVNPFLI